MDNPDPKKADLTIGEVAARTGVAVTALRFYERKGLISSARTGGNQRRYTRDVLRRVAVIQVGQSVGMPLSDLRDTFAGLPEERTPTRADWERLSDSWREELDFRISQMEKLRDRLTEGIGCGCLSIDRCVLRNRDDHLGDQGPGPRLLLDPARS